MLKISKTREGEREVLLMLEGAVTEQWATLLDEVCRSYLLQEKVVQLDCAHVDFVDARGVEVLKNLPRELVTLMGAPGYVTHLLRIGDRP
jgi:ABC-type transporter Mla MlaB component